MGEVDQEGERDQPDGGGEQDVGALDAAAQVGGVGVFHGLAGFADLAGDLVDGYIAQAGGVEPDFFAVADQVIQAVAILAGAEEALAFEAAGETSHAFGPGSAVERV